MENLDIDEDLLEEMPLFVEIVEGNGEIDLSSNSEINSSMTLDQINSDSHLYMLFFIK